MSWFGVASGRPLAGREVVMRSDAGQALLLGATAPDGRTTLADCAHGRWLADVLAPAEVERLARGEEVDPATAATAGHAVTFVVPTEPGHEVVLTLPTR